MQPPILQRGKASTLWQTAMDRARMSLVIRSMSITAPCRHIAKRLRNSRWIMMQNDVVMTITMMQGKLITFEGSEGAGKTTQITKLASFLEANGIDVVITREPGGTPLGEKIRALLLNDEMDEVTELLLMFAARREHWITKIKPALDAGTWVISDRF